MSTLVAEETQVQQAVFSVCASSDAVGTAMGSIEDINGTVFAGEFKEYIVGSRVPQFSALLKGAAVCVALVDCDSNAEGALETMERLQQAMPTQCRLIALSSTMDATFLVKAMRAGCNEFLHKPIKKDELSSALRRFQATATMDTPMAGASGKAVAFVGAKGGVGTTTLLVHVGLHLVRTHKKRVLLVDQRHQLGHVGLYLGVKETKYHFDELLRNSDRMDAHLLEGLTRHHASGLDVIASQSTCTTPTQADPDDAIAVVSFLRQRYDYVLIDSESECTEWLPAMVRCCDRMALVCNPDVASLRDMARHIERLNLTEGFEEKMTVVVNRTGSEAAVSKEDIEKAIRYPVNFEVPNCYNELLKAVNTGEPIAPTVKGKFTQSIAKWAQQLSALTDGELKQATTKKRFGLWR